MLAGQKTEKSHRRQQQLSLPGRESRVPGGWEPLSSDVLPAQLGVPRSTPGTGCCFLARVVHKQIGCTLCSALGLPHWPSGWEDGVLLCLADGRASAAGGLRTAFRVGEDGASSRR